MIRGFAVLVALQFVGEWICRTTGVPIPGNVVGMGLLLVLLRLEWVKLEWVKEAAELLLSHLALFFVPAGVGIMVYFDLVAAQWLPISLSLVLSTFVVMAVTGWTDRLLAGKGGSHAE